MLKLSESNPDLLLNFESKYRTLLKRNLTLQKRPTAIYGKIEQSTYY